MISEENNERPREAAEQKHPLRKWTVLAVIGIGLAAGSGVATAVGSDLVPGAQLVRMGWGGGWHHDMQGHHGMGRVLENLDLTDAQEDRIWKIMNDVRGDALPLFRELRDTREDLASLLGAASIDRAAVEALRAERIGQIDEASRKLAAALIDAADVLTPEQRAKLAEEVKQRGWRGR
jgi:Spy/CpxP family protein refolding chaperone